MNGFDTNLIEIVDNFHFIRPWFLIALLPLFVMLYFLRKQVRSQSGWQGVLATHLYDNLVSTESGPKSTPPWSLLFAGWLITCLALAGPTWERLPQPVYQISKGKVILVDMSMSMRAEDIKPNRLSRVRFKAMDLLASLQEGETGMVAYAGEAFVISPLTSDVQNLEALIPSLSPEIMPSQGSDALFALETTFELLKNAGYQSGDIFWITDGIELSEVALLRNLIADHDYRINILAVGTEDGAPIKITNGNFLKDRSGAVVIPKLRTSTLSSIARSSGGRFVVSRPDDADINYLAEARVEPEQSEETESENSFGDQWKEFGPWLLLVLLPIAAYGFRRGVLPIFLIVMLFDAQKPVYANWWDNLWQTRDQQGAKSFNDQDYLSAAGQFEDPMWKGLSHFNAGDFEKAAEVYATMDTVEGNFSLGNALAQTQQYPEAIAAYERVLELDPDYPNAAENKQYLEDLMQQQQQDPQQNSDENSDNSEQNQQDQNSQQDSRDSEQSESEQNESDQSEANQSESQQQQSSDPQQQDQQDAQQQESQQQDAEQNAQEMSEEQMSEQEGDEENAEEMAQQAQMQEQQELTDEQKEQLQKIENWLRKVPDDPAFLLKRKMLLEQQRRQRQRFPASEQKNW